MCGWTDQFWGTNGLALTGPTIHLHSVVWPPDAEKYSSSAVFNIFLYNQPTITGGTFPHLGDLIFIIAPALLLARPFLISNLKWKFWGDASSGSFTLFLNSCCPTSTSWGVGVSWEGDPPFISMGREGSF